MSKEKIAYTEAAQAIKTAILQGQYEAAVGVNRVQLAVYYAVGRYLSQHTRKAAWGNGAMKAISEQLRKELPGLRGFSERTLKNMRLFYEAWVSLDSNSAVMTAELQNPDSKGHKNSAVMTAELDSIDEDVKLDSLISVSAIENFPIEDFFRVPFSHHVEIVSLCKSLQERYYYIRRTAEERIPVRTLHIIIKNDDYHHQGALPNNFERTISDTALARKAVMMFKDEYLLNFINVEQIGERDIQDVDERVVEQQIVQNVKNFIMTFGHDFAFIGNQYHLEVYSEEFFPDLLFFNRELNCMVCIELKTGKFKPSYLGQLAAYLRILDDTVKKPHENHSIGIVLCVEADKRFVEYVVQDYDKPMGVATYKTAGDMPDALRRALPDEEVLRKLLEGEYVTMKKE